MDHQLRYEPRIQTEFKIKVFLYSLAPGACLKADWRGLFVRWMTTPSRTPDNFLLLSASGQLCHFAALCPPCLSKYLRRKQISHLTMPMFACSKLDRVAAE